ncbi:hypothetical protein L2735_01775 [Shewanella olleyana]|uniref:hypothetical protein n=1 Tax=Shewanella olleyana TaxID=135626 RepID=UPI00200FA927|nr:hypothetical protein [Shewanella olleyana]MCL1065545.1 hypothetical protein [Shewanella olleyana]
MLEIEYSINELTTLMYVESMHDFCFIDQQWIKASKLNVGDEILARSGAVAVIVTINAVDTRHPDPQLVSKLRDVKLSHNHHFFVTKKPSSALDVNCEQAPTDPLELIPYELANKPSYFPNGEPTGHHSGPWVAAKYIDDSGFETVGWGRADDSQCAEDAAVFNLKSKIAKTALLNRQNVTISHAYIRKYSKRGRLINTMSPCSHCRENYGKALNDKRIGESNLIKSGREYLPDN